MPSVYRHSRALAIGCIATRAHTGHGVCGTSVGTGATAIAFSLLDRVVERFEKNSGAIREPCGNKT